MSSREIRKEIFLIGKFNAVMQELNELLSQHFKVQLCSDNLELIKGMLGMSRPDLIFISLIGMFRGHNAIFSELKYKYPSVPVICLGTEKEQEVFEQYFHTWQFQRICRPIDNGELLTEICDRLHIEIEQEQETAQYKRVRYPHILLVDDNAVQLRGLKGILGTGYDVAMATSAAEAMMLIGKQIPDLIFLDYEMPLCNGKMLLEMIRNLEEAKNVPVVFLTGIRDREHIKAVLELNPAAYLLKPATSENIMNVVHSILKEKGTKE